MQFRHAEWMNDLRQRRAAYSVHLSFLVPGIMSLGAMIAGDIKILWRLVFIVACAFGILAMIFLMAGASPGMRETPRRLFHPPGALADDLALRADCARGRNAEPGRNLRWEPQTAPDRGPAADVAGVRGCERRLGLPGGTAGLKSLKRQSTEPFPFVNDLRIICTSIDKPAGR